MAVTVSDACFHGECPHCDFGAKIFGFNGELSRNGLVD